MDWLQVYDSHTVGEGRVDPSSPEAAHPVASNVDESVIDEGQRLQRGDQRGDAPNGYRYEVGRHDVEGVAGVQAARASP